AVRFARQRGIRCIVNPAPAPARAPAPGPPSAQARALGIDLAAFAGVDYFIPNETEAETLTGVPLRSVDDARTCATALMSQGLAGVIITLGAQGALLARDGRTELLPGYDVSVRDTTGAGDAFVGSFAAFLCEGLPERDALARANLYAALSTMRVGTQ